MTTINSRLSRSDIKMLIMITMFINHTVCIFSERLPHSVVVFGQMIGGVTFPIVSFFLVHGFYHTKDIDKYTERITVFWILSVIPFYLAHDSLDTRRYFTITDLLNNVFFTLLVSLLMLRWLSKTRNIVCKSLIVVSSMLLTFFSDWGVIGVIAILLDYVFYGKKCMIYITPIFIGTIFIFLELFECYFIDLDKITGLVIIDWICYGIGYLSSIHILKCYDPESKRPEKWLQWGSYIFYPIHLLILWWLAVKFR